MSRDKSAYAVLGLRPGAGRAEVDDAYRRLIKRYHPDMTGGDCSRAAEINRAYTLLRNKGAATPPRPRVRTQVPVPVPVQGRRPAPPGRTRWAVLGGAAILAAVGLANSESTSRRGSGAFWLPLQWPELTSRNSDFVPSRAATTAAGSGRSTPVSPLSSFEEPLDTAVVDRAIADARNLHETGDAEGAVEFSRACHDKLREEPSLTWFDSCAAFDEAMVILGGSRPLEDSGRFDAPSLISRQMSAARMISADMLAADSRLHRIRSRVEMALVPMLSEAAAKQP